MGRTRWFAVAVLAAGAVGAPVVAARPAAASMTGGCTAVGTWALGTGVGPIVVDVAAVPADKVTVIPADDVVTWTATSPGVPGPKPTKGRVEIDLPWPLGTQTIESWSGTSDKVDHSGTYTYELTGAFPRGVDFTIIGSHAEPNVRCTGQVSFEIEGGPFDAWITYVAVAGLLLSGVVLLLAGRSKWARI